MNLHTAMLSAKAMLFVVPLYIMITCYLQGKVQASSAELDKIKAESKQQADKAEKLASQSQKKCQGQVDIVNNLQEKRESMTTLLESLKSQLCSVQSMHFIMERELGEKISTLTPHERHLSVSYQVQLD